MLRWSLESLAGEFGQGHLPPPKKTGDNAACRGPVGRLVGPYRCWCELLNRNCLSPDDRLSS